MNASLPRPSYLCVPTRGPQGQPLCGLEHDPAQTLVAAQPVAAQRLGAELARQVAQSGRRLELLYRQQLIGCLRPLVYGESAQAAATGWVSCDAREFPAYRVALLRTLARGRRCVFTLESRGQLLARLEVVQERALPVQVSPKPSCAPPAQTGPSTPSSTSSLPLSAQQARWVQDHMELARRLSYTVSEGLLNREELQSIGYQALVSAARRYDPNHPRRATFATFAGYRVRGAMIDAARRLNPGRRLRRRRRRRRGSDPEAGPAFLTDRVPGIDTRSQEWLPTCSVTADEMLLWRERRARLPALLQTLDPADRELLHALYDQERSMSALGRETGVSTSTLSRRHARVIAQLRERAMTLEAGPAPRCCRSDFLTPTS